MKFKFVALLIGALIATAGASGLAEAKTINGLASFYKTGMRTANVERFNPNGMTAAHRTLPFGTRVQVTDVKTGRSVVVRINDRGPFIRNRVIDLSLGAARVVGLQRAGVARVKMVVLN